MTPPKSAAPSPQKAPGPETAASGPGASPLCSHLFCSREATNGDLCEPHADLMADIRKDWEDRSADFEDGWV